MAQQHAFIDKLTGLANRRKFDAELAAILEEAETASMADYHGFAVLYIDLDKFKEHNDRLGHESGDRLLKEAAATLTHALWQHKDDVVARIGGDEFAVLLRDLDEDSARKVTDRLRDQLQFNNVPASIGAIFCPTVLIVGRKAIIKAADGLMYQAKALRRKEHTFVFAQFGVFSPV